MAYKLVGKIEVAPPFTKDPQGNGLVRQKIGMDLKIRDNDGKELDNDRVIDEGYAFEVRAGFTNSDGNEVILFEGKGAQIGPDGKTFLRVPEGQEHEDCAVPNPGYTEHNTGISAILDSNGLRMYPNFKHQEEGCYTAFAEVKGVGKARFPRGATICFGAVKKRRMSHK